MFHNNISYYNSYNIQYDIANWMDSITYALQVSYMARYRQRPIQVEPNSEKVCQSLAWHLPKKEHTHLYRM